MSLVNALLCSSIFLILNFTERDSGKQKLKEGKFKLYIRKKSLTVRVVRHWNTLPSKAGDDPTLESFKARVDGDVRNLV